MSFVSKKNYKIGDLVKVTAIDPPCYELPPDLLDGATVKVIGKAIGYDTVEYGGRTYHLSMVLIDSGQDTLPAGAPFRLHQTDYKRLAASARMCAPQSPRSCAGRALCNDSAV